MHRRIRRTEERARSTNDTERTRTHGTRIRRASGAHEKDRDRGENERAQEEPRKSRGRVGSQSVHDLTIIPTAPAGWEYVHRLMRSLVYPLERSQALVVPRDPPKPRALKRHPGSRGPQSGTGPPTPSPPTRDCPSIAEKTDCVYLPPKQLRNSLRPGDTNKQITHKFTHTITHKVPR